MKFSALVFTAAFALTAVSASAEGGSEFQTQTPEGAMDLTPKLTFGNKKYSLKPSGDTKLSSMNTHVEFEYGINEAYSVGVDIGMDSTTSKITSITPDNKFSGMTNPVLFFKGRMAMGEGSFRYGTDLSVSLGDNETKANGDKNMSTGGHSLTPFVGYEMPCPLVAGSTTGVRLSHDLHLGDRNQVTKGATDTKYKAKGGEVTTLSFFHETPYSETVAIGAALIVDSATKTKTTNSVTNVVTTTGGETNMNVKVYVPVKLEAAVLLPAFTYTKVTAFDNTSFSSASGYSLDLAARFSF